MQHPVLLQAQHTMDTIQTNWHQLKIFPQAILMSPTAMSISHFFAVSHNIP
jgi:hypothetical protein